LVGSKGGTNYKRKRGQGNGGWSMVGRCSSPETCSRLGRVPERRSSRKGFDFLEFYQECGLQDIHNKIWQNIARRNNVFLFLSRRSGEEEGVTVEQEGGGGVHEELQWPVQGVGQAGRDVQERQRGPGSVVELRQVGHSGAVELDKQHAVGGGHVGEQGAELGGGGKLQHQGAGPSRQLYDKDNNFETLWAKIIIGRCSSRSGGSPREQGTPERVREEHVGLGGHQQDHHDAHGDEEDVHGRDREQEGADRNLEVHHESGGEGGSSTANQDKIITTCDKSSSCYFITLLILML
jgi:hypothetical protein